MTKRILLVLLACLTISVQAFSQSVRGKVVDAKGEAIPGAGVVIKGTSNGTVTDIDGNYQLNAASNAVLSFSCVGYASQDVAVNGQSVVNVTLAEDSELLDDVVVVAYGTAKKKDLTGSIGTVDSKTIAVQAQGSVTRMLDGQVAGLQTTSGDGQPGLDMVIRVRGLGTANPNSSNALVVIDGAPAIEGTNPLSSINSNDIESITVLKDAASTALYGARGANGVVLVTTKSGKQGKTKISLQARWGVNTVDSNSAIKKIGDGGVSEIYEATWEAIYNDVYYRAQTITDKAAAAEFASKHLFDYSYSTTNFGINGLGNRMAYKVPGVAYVSTGTSSTMADAYLVNTDGKINPNARLLYSGNTISDDIVENRFRQEYVAAASGATDKIDYHMSLGYLSDPSYVAMSGFDRYTARANVNAQVTSWLKAGAKFSYAHRKITSVDYRGNSNTNRNIGTNTENPFLWRNWGTALDQTYARDFNGNFKYDADGNRLVAMHTGQTVDGTAYNDSPLGSTVYGVLKNAATAVNTMAYFHNQQNAQVYDDLTSKGYLRASFLKHFTAEVNLSYDATFGNKTRFFDKLTAGPRLARKQMSTSAISRTKTVYSVLNTQQLINYNQNFGKNHVDAMIGHEYYEYNYEKQAYASANNLIDNYLGYANFLGTQSYAFSETANSGDLSKLAMESYLGRANYNFDERYYLSASVRYDGSSKFKKPEKRWGLFWSVGGGWRISSEPWMQDTKDWLSNLKLRASYGVIGNQNGVDAYSGYQLWTYAAGGWAGSGVATYPSSVTLTKKGYSYSDDLTWEKVNTFDAGLDFTLWNGKVSGTFDYFNKETPNAIYSQKVSYMATGQATFTSNCAGIRSRGIELELSYQPVKTKDWDVILSTNGTHYTTVLTSVPEGFGSEALGGCETANAQGIDIAGTGADVPNCYLRGVGKDYYNLYLYRYGGVAGNTGKTYFDKNNVAHTGYTKGDAEAGRPLYYHKVTEAEAKAKTFGNAVEGDDILTTNGNLASKYEVGSAIPAWIGGFTASARYKGFDLSVMMSYQLGGKYYSVEYANGGDGGRYNGSFNIQGGFSISRELLGNTWNENNPDAKFPMLCYSQSSAGDGGAAIGNTQNYTDLALFDASYLAVKNITFGYTFPAKWMNKAKISNLRIFASADNPFLIYSHSGVDPRRSISGGTDLGAAQYPYLAVYSFGINLDF